MRAELEKLIELQKTDTNIRRLKQLIASADKRRADIEQEFEQHAFSIREIQNRRESLNASRTDIENKIAENKTYLENLIKKPIEHFAYPSGKFNHSSLESVDEAGYKLAVTTNHKNITNKSPMFQLGRFQVDNINSQTFERNLQHWFK